MKTLAERLKYMLYKLDLNQADAAKKVGISQQSFNYLIRNNVSESKLSSKIADKLQVNPEWLIYGRGEMLPSPIYSIPIIKDYLTLMLYLNDREVGIDIKKILSASYISEKPFSVNVENNKIAICSNRYNTEENDRIKKKEYILFDESNSYFIVDIEGLNKKNIYHIIEWRIYND